MTRLLLVLPSVVREIDGELAVDADFRESLKIALEKFDAISVACPITRNLGDAGLRHCIPVAELPWRDRVKFIRLPDGYHPRDFARHYLSVRRVLKAEIEQSDFLVFSPHTLIGDWPTVAAREATKQKRAYVIEADVVYESLARLASEKQSRWKRLVKNEVLLPLFLRSYRRCLANSALGLFQGQDVYDAYARYCRKSQKVYHHVPIYQGGHITDAELQGKLAELKTGRPLKVCYAGRAIPMKGPDDWIDALLKAIESGVKLNATWIGEGTLLDEMKAKVQSRGLAEHFSFPGFIEPERVLRAMKEADIFLFCHKTQESARCLGEALAAGCPLVGYDSGYPAELVALHGGGRLVAPDDTGALATVLQRFDQDRGQLHDMIIGAARTGQMFNREARLRERDDAVRAATPPRARTGL